MNISYIRLTNTIFNSLVVGGGGMHADAYIIHFSRNCFSTIPDSSNMCACIFAFVIWTLRFSNVLFVLSHTLDWCSMSDHKWVRGCVLDLYESYATCFQLNFIKRYQIKAIWLMCWLSIHWKINKKKHTNTSLLGVWCSHFINQFEQWFRNYSPLQWIWNSKKNALPSYLEELYKINDGRKNELIEIIPHLMADRRAIFMLLKRAKTFDCIAYKFHSNYFP